MLMLILSKRAFIPTFKCCAKIPMMLSEKQIGGRYESRFGKGSSLAAAY
jgi:hypothetical protein